jgi:hypothetical protein
MNQIETQRKGRRSRIELCIDLWVSETGYVPDDARQVWDPTELSPQLERFVSTIRAPHAWRAWAIGPRSWFLDGVLTDSPAGFDDQPTLILTFRDHDAQAAAAGVWRRVASRRWEPQQIVDSSALSSAWH